LSQRLAAALSLPGDRVPGTVAQVLHADLMRKKYERTVSQRSRHVDAPPQGRRLHPFIHHHSSSPSRTSLASHCPHPLILSPLPPPLPAFFFSPLLSAAPNTFFSFSYPPLLCPLISLHPSFVAARPPAFTGPPTAAMVKVQRPVCFCHLKACCSPRLSWRPFSAVCCISCTLLT
jgi:hypothetical protein